MATPTSAPHCEQKGMGSFSSVRIAAERRNSRARPGRGNSIAIHPATNVAEIGPIQERGVTGAPHVQYNGRFILDAHSNFHLLDLASTRIYIVKNREKIGRAMQVKAKRPEESGFT